MLSMIDKVVCGMVSRIAINKLLTSATEIDWESERWCGLSTLVCVGPHDLVP